MIDHTISQTDYLLIIFQKNVLFVRSFLCKTWGKTEQKIVKIYKILLILTLNLIK